MHVVAATSEGYPEDWDLEGMLGELGQVYPVSLSVADLEARSGGGRHGLSQDYLVEELTEDAQEAYDRREQEFGESVMREMERRVIMSVLDKRWREHLYEMDYQGGHRTASHGQKDPLVEYQREGYDLFVVMMNAIGEEAVHHLFTITPEVHAPQVSVAEPGNFGITGVASGQVTSALASAGGTGPGALDLDANTNATVNPGTPEVTPEVILPEALAERARPGNLQYSAPTAEGGVEKHSESVANVDDPDAGGDTRSYAGTAKNAMCPCGSGRKYKRCHGAAGRGSGAELRQLPDLDRRRSPAAVQPLKP